MGPGDGNAVSSQCSVQDSERAMRNRVRGTLTSCLFGGAKGYEDLIEGIYKCAFPNGLSY